MHQKFPSYSKPSKTKSKGPAQSWSRMDHGHFEHTGEISRMITCRSWSIVILWSSRLGANTGIIGRLCSRRYIARQRKRVCILKDWWGPSKYRWWVDEITICESDRAQIPFSQLCILNQYDDGDWCCNAFHHLKTYNKFRLHAPVKLLFEENLCGESSLSTNMCCKQSKLNCFEPYRFFVLEWPNLSKDQ